VAGFWQALISSGALALIFIPIARLLYVRLYLSKRLFFEPWCNLSRNENLNIGGALAELLFFELEGIRKLLEEAKSDSGRLWNDKSALPALERSFDGYPEFVRHTELLGLPGKISNVVKLVLLTKPQAIRGSIHQYGSSLRFQVVLDGLRGKRGVAGTRCWATLIDADQPQGIPDAVSELAHNIVLDFGKLQGFKSPQSFRHFTSGLRQHLAYNTLRRPVFLQQAETFYQLSIDHEGGNSEASCNLGDLLYSQFTFETNEKAIEAYLGALKTEKPLVRARAFRGLANAYCQRWQRHKRGDEGTVEAALRWARFAGDLCQESALLAPEDKATIKKAQAYAQQVWAEFGNLDLAARDIAFQKAVDLYREAIDLNERFTIAYNNVSYLFLKRAEETIDRWLACPDSKRDRILEQAVHFIEEAEKWCRDAIKTERTFHMAYDNQGNIAVVRAKLLPDNILDAESNLGSAVECYHKALSYQPGYREAYSDLARAHASLFDMYGSNSHSILPASSEMNCENINRNQFHHARLAWRYHWDALKYTGDLKGKSVACHDFKRLLSINRLPDCESILFDEAGRGAEVECACLERGL